MGKGLLKEITWFLAAAFATAYVYYGIIPTILYDGVFNIHDTYYVIEAKSELLFPALLFSFHLIYLIRIFWERLTNITGNSIFLLLNTLLIAQLLYLAISMDAIGANTIYLPASALTEKEDILKAQKGISGISTVLYGAATVLSILELLAVYKIYRKIKPAKKP